MNSLKRAAGKSDPQVNTTTRPETTCSIGIVFFCCCCWSNVNINLQRPTTTTTTTTVIKEHIHACGWLVNLSTPAKAPRSVFCSGERLKPTHYLSVCLQPTIVTISSFLKILFHERPGFITHNYFLLVEHSAVSAGHSRHAVSSCQPGPGSSGASAAGALAEHLLAPAIVHERQRQ